MMMTPLLRALFTVLLSATCAGAFTVTRCSAAVTIRPSAAALQRKLQPPLAVTPVEFALTVLGVTGVVVVGGTATVLAGSAEFQLPMERRRAEEAAAAEEAALQKEYRLER